MLYIYIGIYIYIYICIYIYNVQQNIYLFQPRAVINSRGPATNTARSTDCQGCPAATVLKAARTAAKGKNTCSRIGVPMTWPHGKDSHSIPDLWLPSPDILGKFPQPTCESTFRASMAKHDTDFLRNMYSYICQCNIYHIWLSHAESRIQNLAVKSLQLSDMFFHDFLTMGLS